MTAVGKYNPNSIIKGYVRGLGLNETSNTDRHIMLADIRAALGSEKFSEWYNEVYKLRSAGKHAEYEQAIKAMFGELPASHPAPEDVDAVSSMQARAEQLENELNDPFMTKEVGLPALDELARLYDELEP